MGKIVLYTNVKGGVGKTTLCGIFATYLANSGRTVAVVDADLQQSLFRHRKRDLQQNPDASLPWEINTLRDRAPEEVAIIMEGLKQLPYDVIIDCPGNLVDPNLEVIYSNADIAVVPIHYDSDTLDATQMFCEIFKAHFGAKIFFVPNGIVSVEERREHLQQERDKAIEQLKAYGTVTPRIKRSVVISDYNTLLPLTIYQRNAVKYAFEPIINELQEGGEE
jgi:chromosome partitioning protein